MKGARWGPTPPHPLHFLFVTSQQYFFFHFCQYSKLKKLLMVKRSSTIESWTWQKQYLEYRRQADDVCPSASSLSGLVSLADHFSNYLTYLLLKSWSYCFYVGCFYLVRNLQRDLHITAWFWLVCLIKITGSLQARLSSFSWGSSPGELAYKLNE